MTAKRNIPSVLLKYFPPPGATSYAQDNLISTLKNGRIRLTGADEVNDIFEHEPYFSGDIRPREFYSHLLRAFESSNSVNSHLADIGESLRGRFKSKFVLKRDYKSLYREVKERIPTVFRESLRKLPFYCLSEVTDSQLMWAHYAASHTGVCIGFDTRFTEFPGNSLPVTYSQARTKVALGKYLGDWSNPRVDEDVFKVLTTKNTDWEYEQEWRFIGVSLNTLERLEVGAHIEFERKAIRKIILGAKASEETRAFIIEQVADLDPQPTLCRAVPSDKEFAMIIRTDA